MDRANAIARGLVTILTVGALRAEARPELSVTPEAGLIDAPFHVRVQDAEPGSRVTLTASRSDAKGHIWTAIGEYSADAQGVVDVDVSPSLSGSYEGVSPHGLWCSALPVAPDKLNAYIVDLPEHPASGTAPELEVGVDYPVMLSAGIRGKTVASATARRTYATGIKSKEVTTPDGVRGVFFPAAAGATPGVPVVVLAGSGGGLPLTQAALLASHGHPALAQGIFAYKDLPAALVNIPLESFQAGAHWLEQRTGARRVAIMGTSRGSEAAGLSASYFPEDFAAAIVYVPSHLVNDGFGPGVKDLEPAWTLGGKPLSPDPGNARNEASNSVLDRAALTALLSKPPGLAGTPSSLERWNDPRAAATYGIPYERMRGPVLALGGGADEMWPSSIGAAQIRRRLAAHGKVDLSEVHTYAGAGHLVSRVGAGGPMSAFIFHPVAKVFLATGGLPNANCEGSYDAWQQVLKFLDKIEPRAAGKS